ncbi:Uncharacterised protein [Listeria grayi]|uniref:Flagellar FliJ protein n=1 Tax=Listeria grayi FSL F6-1183 TaxID=1265827 RepID=A0A829R673_LISGR|nr:hypothetical protein [Listeria grayi]EUJ27524.1 hypothetical protein LMUR_08299 [Listeria grayi FSL F6-1183]VEI35320.1 Uncharacterised protein [Listeria grayi]
MGERKQKWHAIEEAFIADRNRLERDMEYIDEEKRRFVNQMEDMAERIHYTNRKRGSDNQVNTTSIYQMLEQAQNEGQQLASKAIRSLEDKIEEKRRDYQKQFVHYEEELRLFKANGGE